MENSRGAGRGRADLLLVRMAEIEAGNGRELAVKRGSDLLLITGLKATVKSSCCKYGSVTAGTNAAVWRKGSRREVVSPA